MFVTAERRETTPVRWLAGSGTPGGRNASYPRPGFSVEAVQTPARVKVKCVTPLGEDVASTS